MSRYGRWDPYVPVAKRRAKAQKKMAALRKKGYDIQPIEIEGRKIARTFWGEGWCDHLESFSDYGNRLSRGRTYVRNGSVCHLAIQQGQIEAKVAGSSIYEVRVDINTLAPSKWKAIQQSCAGQIGSLLELLQGKLSENIMSVVTDRKTGLFPKPAEIKFGCDCPDYAGMCKHIAAVLYGVGARLDVDPSLLFRLRGVNHEDLIESQVVVPTGTGKGKSKRLSAGNLGDVFGIELETESSQLKKTSKEAVKKTPKKTPKKVAKKTPKKTPKKVAKKTPKKTPKKAASKKGAGKAKANTKKSMSDGTDSKPATKKRAVNKLAGKKATSPSKQSIKPKATPRKATKKKTATTGVSQ